MLHVKKNFDRDNFSLVLSGGGALGIAQLGVVSDMQIKAWTPSEIVGTSMGAIIGACIAIGMKEEEIYAHIVEFSSVQSWVKFSFTGNSIIKTQKIDKILESIFQDMKIKDAKIPLKIIATNIQTGDIKVFTCRDDVMIKDAVLASMAIPGIFEEQKIDGVVYSDGFLCENLGINQATCRDILAIDVLGKNSFSTEMPDNFFKTSNVLEMFEKSMRILIYNQTKLLLENSTENILHVEPNTKEFKTFHFHKHKELRALGLDLLADINL